MIVCFLSINEQRIVETKRMNTGEASTDGIISNAWMNITDKKIFS